MTNPLKSLSLQELWELFPIVLSPHQPQWAELAHEEIGTLSELLAGFSPILNHIGSTAIPDIQAKPIIDILMEVPAEAKRGNSEDIGRCRLYLHGGFRNAAEFQQRIYT